MTIVKLQDIKSTHPGAEAGAEGLGGRADRPALPDPGEEARVGRVNGAVRRPCAELFHFFWRLFASQHIFFPSCPILAFSIL